MRSIDADALIVEIEKRRKATKTLTGIDMVMLLKDAPTVGGWISVKDRVPEEHPSMFYKLYGTEKWDRAMWRTESDRVLVAIKFPDGTRTVDKGKLQDGAWRTGVSPVLPQEVTHWALWPEPPEEEA